jgi:glycosyltransferase involved in cell wall biosynthesis
MTHELLPEFSKDLGSLKAKRAAIAECDHIICVSENTKRDLLSVMNVEDSKISVVPLGATPLTVDPGACTWPSPFILFVGLRHGYKNFGKLLQSYADSFRLRESFNLICFGGGEFSKREKLEFARLGLNPEKITQIAGDDGTLAAYYSKAAAFVYPSLYEGFGLPILEAMGCGCPVACSKRSSFPEVAGGAARYFDPESSENMAEVLKDIVFSDTQRSSMIAEGHRRTGIFDWERCAEATEKIYATLT